jgi:sugar phosphate isomerase/epimerase
MVFLALSCLQGRPMDAALAALAELEPDGVQLTPGNQPTPDFAKKLKRTKLATRTHHGFSFTAFRTRDVWADDGRCLAESDSVHPPASNAKASEHYFEKRPAELVLETMYPSYALGSGDELERAMALHVPLAVDVSHLFIQRTQGVLSEATLRRVLDYDNVHEVHVSANDGRRDLHAPLTPRTFGLEWAHERERTGVPLILECYFHRLSLGERARQLALVRGERPLTPTLSQRERETRP